MMRRSRNQGYSLSELMIALSIGMVLMLALIKLYNVSAQMASRQLKRSRLNLASDEVEYHLRRLINFAKFEPNCVDRIRWRQRMYFQEQNNEFLRDIREELIDPIKIFPARSVSGELDLINAKNHRSTDFPNISLMDTSDLLSISYLTPIAMTNNAYEIDPSALYSGSEYTVLFTDCRSSYLTMLSSKNDSSHAPNYAHDNILRSIFPDAERVQAFIVYTNIVYVSKESGSHFLVTHFQDGSHRYLIKNIVYFRILESSDQNIFPIDIVAVADDSYSKDRKVIVPKLYWRGEIIDNAITLKGVASDYKRSLLIVRGFNL